MAGIVFGQNSAQPGSSVQTFSGTAPQATPGFTVADKWEVRWDGPRSLNIAVLGSDGAIVAGAAGSHGALFVPKGGNYHLQIDCAPAPDIPNQDSSNGGPGPPALQNTLNGGLNGGGSNDSNSNGTSSNNGSTDNNGNPSINRAQMQAQMQAMMRARMLRPWQVEVVEMSLPTAQDATYALLNFVTPSGAGMASGSIMSATSSPPGASVPAATVKLTEDQARAVVLIKGDNAEGTGFLIKTADGPAVLTNIHVISNNPNLKITTSTGAVVTMLSAKGASDRDLALLSIQDAGYSYLEMCPDVSKAVQPGDEVITPGNSEGGEVMLNTGGKVLGIGPQRIEIDNPIYHGNSGGPIYQTKTGKVLGVVTEAMKVDATDDLDKASFASRNSAISGSMRYFGLRVDTVPGWQAYDWRRFQNETAFLDQFDKQSRCLDCYLNAPDDNKPEDTLWRGNDKIMKANDDFAEQTAGGDSSQRMDAIRELYSDLDNIVGIDVDAIQNLNGFYSFDQQRAQDEIAYRKALKTELDAASNDVSRMGSLARKND
jgi:S1-C subfamily serine protease